MRPTSTRHARLAKSVRSEKLFTRVNGVWIDSGFKKEMPLAKITCLSDEYFALLADHPGIARFLALGDRIIFTIDGKTAISIVP